MTLKEGMPPEAARTEAERRSACVYSPNQEDGKPSEDPWIDAVRHDLVRWYLDETAEKLALTRFEKADDPLAFLIVCNKLLTGFDAPIEGAMYLDSPLRDHNLLQAIARTNRVYGEEHQKPYGLIVDYIGVTRSVGEALASYRKADVENALRDLAELEADLRRAHAQVMALLEGIDRGTGAIKAEYEALAAKLGSAEAWFDYETRARSFIRAYEALAPDPAILPYRDDLKWVATSLPWLRKTIVHEFRLDLPPAGEIAEPPTRYGDHVDGLGTLAKVARDLDRLYASDETAPPGWHRKDQLRKELRQKVRSRAHEARLTDLIAVPTRVEEFAMRHHAKLGEPGRS